ncbi:hypothetical protein DU002_09135 [Corallincola holothuriorum]|uniref:Uncharacterized protein n=1 Tax=Corallincola holothuriorum TaxID=2282215 RepID=A0A368NJ16_9GAMM|nr:hypothetical protein [Corallincola holothuriorum]RCU50572.1 hypothetical protein DU002_09135 [Corallincola holothuriorum]
MEYLEPWEEYEKNHEAAAKELARELCPAHILYKVKASAVAYRCDCDDVLFKLSGFTHEYAVVHLTYSKETEPAYPSTELFESKEAWVTNCMLPDHEDYTC